MEYASQLNRSQLNSWTHFNAFELIVLYDKQTQTTILLFANRRASNDNLL